MNPLRHIRTGRRLCVRVQTHISWVFPASPFVCKVKKPVNLGFADFSTLEKRRHFCQREVELNQRQIWLLREAAREFRDDEMLRLTDFYKCYRAFVRGKVESIQAIEKETRNPQEHEKQAARYFPLALRLCRN